MFNKLVLFSVLAASLGGCAAPVASYVIPNDIPSANIKSNIRGAGNLTESIDIYLFDKNGDPPGQRHLFAIKKSKSQPEGYVKVPANTPLNFSYYESVSGGRECKLFKKATLDQDKNYILVGGFDYESGPIPILTGTRKCKFGVVEETK